jgi:hypothetical protein
MILSGNLSFTQVVSGGYEGCIVGLVDVPGMQCTRLIRLAVSPTLRAPPRGDWL